MVPQHLILWAAAAASPVAAPPPVPIEVTGAGSVQVVTVGGAGGARYRLSVAERGTVLISVDRIDGPAPQAVLRNAEGQRLRRADRRGKLWARPPAGSVLVLELSPAARDTPSVVQLSVAIDVDRPRAQRAQRRPARPRDIVRVPVADLRGLDGVQVGGLAAEYTIQGGDVFVAIPAFAQRGPIELHFEARPTEIVDVTLIGTEPPRRDLDTGACALTAGAVPAGCVRLDIEPPVGTLWLDAIARIVDADLVRHELASGVVELKLRLPSTEGFALERLRAMPGVRSATSVARGAR